MHVNTDDAFQNQMVFARALNELGYATGYFGKYFNEGGMERLCPTSGDTPAPLAPPQGWSSDAVAASSALSGSSSILPAPLTSRDSYPY